MQSTRRHILEYLGQHQSATALEMSRAFGMTAANIRHHLNELLEERQITRVRSSAASGRGRPEIPYALNEINNNPTIRHLTKSLLALISSPSLSKFPATRIKKGAQLMMGKGKKGSSLSQRLVESVQRFEELGYKAAWEATSQGPQVVFNQCPYADIIEEHPELCHLDKAGLDHLLGEKVSQTRKLAINSKGLPHCTFALKSSLTKTV